MREQLGKAFRKAGDALGNVDDKVQGYARKVLGEKDGRWPEGNVSPMQLGKSIWGDVIHADRREFKNDAAGRTVLGAVRGLQAGGLTLAGVGVANIIDQLTQYGGAADQPTDSQIEIDYNSPAFGSNLSPESHQTYIQIHKGLMKDSQRQNGFADQVRGSYSAGEFDHDQMLKNHIADVMG